MARRYRRNNSFFEGISGVVILISFYLAWLSNTYKISYWLWILWGAMLISVVGIVTIIVSELKSRKQKRILASVQEAGAGEYIDNFINSLGQTNKPDKKMWNYDGYTFTWNQLDSLKRTLCEKGVELSTEDKYKEISFLLRHFIYNKEDRFVRDSIVYKTRTFSSLSPSQFEDLLRRLYEAMGYFVERTGRTGDQGCDLIVNMPDYRAVVQAKNWRSPVGNKAVQEANGALGLYNCTKAYVVTNATFTPEAIQLAKADNVGLIDGHRLRELLLQYVKETWSL
jgi:hypothetical protein